MRKYNLFIPVWGATLIGKYTLKHFHFHLKQNTIMGGNCQWKPLYILHVTRPFLFMNGGIWIKQPF